MDKWILQYITDISVVPSQIASYRKKTELHLQTQHKLLPLMFSFNHQNYSQ